METNSVKVSLSSLNTRLQSSAISKDQLTQIKGGIIGVEDIVTG